MNRESLRRSCRITAALALSAGACASGGCQLLGFIAYTVQESTPKKVAGQYDGLPGQNFTVVVRADRAILADFPGAADLISINVNELLSANLPEPKGTGETTGYIPPSRQLQWLANHPRWRAMMPAELGEELQVSRLVVIDIFSLQLHDAGNRFIWKGEAAGTVRVFAIDSALPNDAVFETQVRVGFPPGEGHTAADYTAAQVQGALIERFARRAAWLMYDHEEPRDLDF